MATFRQHLQRAVAPVVVAAFIAVSFLALFWIVLPRPLNVKVNTVADQTIIATQTVQDQEKTKEARTAAAKAAEPVYTYDSTISGKQLDKLSALQKAVSATQTEAESDAQKDFAAAQKKNDQAVYTAPTTTALLKAFKTAYPKDDNPFFYQFSDRFYRQLFALDKDAQTALFSAVSRTVSAQMSAKIAPTQVDDSRRAARRALDDAELVGDSVQLAHELSNAALVPNELLDAAQTKARQAEASAAVTPVSIMQGQVIVQEGHMIDATAMHQLAVLGLTKKNQRGGSLVAFILFLIIETVALSVVLSQCERNVRTKNAALYGALMLIMTGLMLAIRFVATTGGINLALLLPVAMVPLLLRSFVGRRMALLAALMQTFTAYFAFYSTTGTIFTGGTAVVYLATGILCVMIPKKRLNDVAARTAFWVLGVDLTLNLALLLLQGADFTTWSTWRAFLFVLAGQLLGYLLALGATPYLELVWRDDAVFKLNRLSNPNDPLLRRLLEEAPGTYHHSMMVANLSANAVARIGGRQMLTRVACYYHDVGKLTRPLYFTENMPAGFKTPHADLSPEESAKIIFAHVSDGVAMLKKRNMPQFIVDVCAQHHGTTLMKYFYIEAKNADPNTKESDYRYPGPKPQTLEAAVINIADTCEAAVRSMKHPTPAGIRQFVHNITNERITDGQFDEAPITVAQLRAVEQSLIDGLASTFYNRIEYPKLNEADGETQTDKENEDGSRTDR
ncbi:HD family phosphohydrolase [Lacticaseibacillus yichunensis]|uniref:HD family phosphohydrolase n=1 Tax=Lacticaseibacillus yichunensis TaxID=2486015 RepID=A0ABW4CPJ8_9LACO|nr:HDIG domain-containing metalloprotein [Lacticaseibacillus yichunensis]